MLRGAAPAAGGLTARVRPCRDEGTAISLFRERMSPQHLHIPYKGGERPASSALGVVKVTSPKLTVNFSFFFLQVFYQIGIGAWIGP
jgi:hypothetical protein